MEMVQIQKQQVIGWAVLTREEEGRSWKFVSPIVSQIGFDSDSSFFETQFYLKGAVNGILPAAPGTYRITTYFEDELVILGVSHPGDGLDDQYWLVYADCQLKDKAMFREENRGLAKPYNSSNCPSIK
jgi:hypothetical protein